MLWYAIAYALGFVTIPIIFVLWMFVGNVRALWGAPDEQLRPWARWVRAYIWRPFFHLLDSVDWALGRPMFRVLMAYARRKQAIIVVPRDKVKT